jgi:hypothetical protein
MGEGEKPEQPLNHTGKPDLLILRNELPQPIVDVGLRLGKIGGESLYPVDGAYGIMQVDERAFYRDVFYEIQEAAEASGKAEEFTTLPEMPKVEQCVQEGSITPEDADLYKKRLVSLLVLEPILSNPGNLNQDEVLRLRTSFVALSHRVATRNAVYSPEEMKDASPEFLVALARKNLAQDIVAKGEYVQPPDLQRNTWAIDYALTPDEADALEARFPETYRPNGYLRKAADVFKENQIVLKDNIKNRGHIAYAAYRYKEQGGQPDRTAFLHSLGYTEEDMNALTPQAKQTVDSLLGEKT